MKNHSKNTKNRSFTILAIASAVATISFGVANTGKAAHRRLAAVTACKGLNDHAGSDSPIAQEKVNLDDGWFGFMMYPDNTNMSTALCTIHSDSHLPHSSATNVTLSGYQLTGHDLDVRVCSYDYASNSFDCGSWSDVGSGTLFFNRSVDDLTPLTDHTAWFPVLLVEGMVAPSNLRGIYIAN